MWGWSRICEALIIVPYIVFSKQKILMLLMIIMIIPNSEASGGSSVSAITSTCLSHSVSVRTLAVEFDLWGGGSQLLQVSVTGPLIWGLPLTRVSASSGWLRMGILGWLCGVVTWPRPMSCCRWEDVRNVCWHFCEHPGLRECSYSSSIAECSVHQARCEMVAGTKVMTDDKVSVLRIHASRGESLASYKNMVWILMY